MMTPEQLGEYIERHFTRSAYRWERQPAYEVASDGSDYKRYLDGAAEPMWERLDPWLQVLRDERAEGRDRHRVRLFHSPLTDYERYECEWGYELTGAAGEGIFVLDPADHRLPEVMIDHDFWLLDDEHPVWMHYGPDGTFHGSTVEPALADSYRLAQRTALDLAAPCASWWAQHPEHHRAAHRKAA
ncbi:MAG: hypothetical protein H0V92_04220 [Pseudonocardiales bacterium]|nr:hypothetical protein [Pseudonocardiales bacterium]